MSVRTWHIISHIFLCCSELIEEHATATGLDFGNWSQKSLFLNEMNNYDGTMTSVTLQLRKITYLATLSQNAVWKFIRTTNI